jgi:hypothetical protein
VGLIIRRPMSRAEILAWCAFALVGLWIARAHEARSLFGGCFAVERDALGRTVHGPEHLLACIARMRFRGFDVYQESG